MTEPSAPNGHAEGGEAGDPNDVPDSLARTTMRGAQLAGLGWVASQGLLFATYLVLARLISPSDFGRYAAGTLITGFGGLFAEGGMMAALISRRDGLDEAANS